VPSADRLAVRSSLTSAWPGWAASLSLGLGCDGQLVLLARPLRLQLETTDANHHERTFFMTRRDM
jgi:hypothetical protein